MIRETWLLGLAFLGLPRLGSWLDLARHGLHLPVAWLGAVYVSAACNTQSDG